MIHDEYAKMNDADKELVNQMFNKAASYAVAEGVPIKWDDRAERLVEAIAVYVVESRKSWPGGNAKYWFGY